MTGCWRALRTGEPVGDVLRALRSLPDELGIGCTAAGVESDEQLRWLVDQAVAAAQGHLLRAPSAAEAVQALLAPGGAWAGRG